MFTNNPFSNLAEIVSPIIMQGFVIVMVGLVILGTLIDILHKKNVKYFFDNAKKAKKDLNWTAKTSIQELVKDMVKSELKSLKKHES